MIQKKVAFDRLELNGKIYYKSSHGKIYDEQFTEVSCKESDEVGNILYGNIDFELLAKDRLLDCIQEMKNAEQYLRAEKACKIGLKNYASDSDFIRRILAIYTSCCRLAHRPQDAIKNAEFYLNKFGKLVESEPLYTSLAAAYVDINDSDCYFKMKYKALKLSNNKPSEQLKAVIERAEGPYSEDVYKD